MGGVGGEGEEGGPDVVGGGGHAQAGFLLHGGEAARLGPLGLVLGVEGVDFGLEGGHGGRQGLVGGVGGGVGLQHQ